MTRAGDAFGRLAGAQTRGTESQGAVAPQSQGVVAPLPPASAVVRRFTVRMWSEDEDASLEALRRALRARLGRLPSASETAVAAVVVTARGTIPPGGLLVDLVAEQIRRNPRGGA